MNNALPVSRITSSWEESHLDMDTQDSEEFRMWQSQYGSSQGATYTESVSEQEQIIILIEKVETL